MPRWRVGYDPQVFQALIPIALAVLACLAGCPHAPPTPAVQEAPVPAAHLQWFDFGPDYYRQRTGRAAPPRRRGKFVQLRDPRRREHIVLATYEHLEYHIDIVEAYMKDTDSRGWEVVGGGHYVLDDAARTLRMDRHSNAYGRFDPRGLAGRLRTVPALAGWRIEVE